MVSSTDSAHTNQVPAERSVVFTTAPLTSHTEDPKQTVQRHADSGSTDHDSGLVLLSSDSSAATPINAHQTGDTPVLHHVTATETTPLKIPPSATWKEVTLRPYSEPSYCPTSKLRGLISSQVQEDVISSHHWKRHPSVHPYAATTSTSKRRPLRSPVNGIGCVFNSADTSPRRYSNGAVMVLKRHTLAALPPLFSHELLQRKEMIKSRLQFTSEWSVH